MGVGVTGCQGVGETTPRYPATQSPVTWGPQSPVTWGPQSPGTWGPQSPGTWGPQSPVTWGPQSPVTWGPLHHEQSEYSPITMSAANYSLRFHVLLLPNVGWAELKARVIWLEELRLEVAALADHVVDWTNPTVPWFEAWTALPALAEATHTIRLSTVVTQIPLRNPAMLARQVFTLDHISNGRIELGLGTGLRSDPSSAMIG